MEILLIKDVEGLGHAGQIKKVASGYARNFLIPRGLAVAATAGARKQAEQMLEAAKRRQEHQLTEAKALAEKLSAITLRFTAKAGENDRLYGSITAADIAEAIARELGREVDRRHIELERPLRELGEHYVPIRLHANVEPSVRVVIEREGEIAAA